MRRGNAFVLTLFALLVAPCMLHAAGGSFGLTVKRTASKSSNKPLACPNHPSRLQSMSVQITVRNLAKTNATIKVQWYFMAEKVDTGKTVIFSQGDLKFDLKPSGLEVQTVESGTLATNPPEHSEPTTNAKLIGYLVIATDSEGNTRCEFTRPSLGELGKSPKALEAVKKDTQTWKNAGGGRDESI